MAVRRNGKLYSTAQSLLRRIFAHDIPPTKRKIKKQFFSGWSQPQDNFMYLWLIGSSLMRGRLARDAPPLTSWRCSHRRYSVWTRCSRDLCRRSWFCRGPRLSNFRRILSCSWSRQHFTELLIWTWVKMRNSESLSRHFGRQNIACISLSRKKHITWSRTPNYRLQILDGEGKKLKRTVFWDSGGMGN